MRFLVDADLPRSTVQLLTSYGLTAVDVRDIGLGNAKDSLLTSILHHGSWGSGRSHDIRAYLTFLAERVFCGSGGNL